MLMIFTFSDSAHLIKENNLIAFLALWKDFIKNYPRKQDLWDPGAETNFTIGFCYQIYQNETFSKW